MRSVLSPDRVGCRLAERLGLQVVGTESGNLKCACIACDSSDAMRVHEDTGVGHCFSCDAKWSPFQLCEAVLKDREAAKSLMVELGLFDPRPPGNGKSCQPQVADPIAEVARVKGVSADALKRLGAVAVKGGVRIPMFGPDTKPCSSVFLDTKGGKGLNEKGKPTGLFLPTDTKCEAGETWHVTEGPKDAAALLDLQLLAVGLPGNTLKKDFAPLFKSLHVVLVPDRDQPGVTGAEKTAKLLYGIAASLKVAELPAELKDTGGADVRDVLKTDGGREKVLTALELAKPVRADGKPVKVVEFKLITSQEFFSTNYRERFIVDKILVAGEPAIVGGRYKVMKTSVALDLVLSLGTGTPFLGKFKVPRSAKTILFSGESGQGTLQRTALQIAKAKKVDPAQAEVVWGWNLPQIASDDHLAGLKTAIQQHRAKVVVIDPAYLCLLAGDDGGRNPGDIFAMGEILLRLTGVGQEAGCTVLLIHHCRKTLLDPWKPPELEDLSMAGFAEWARQWLLLGRRESYVQDSGLHRLWLNVGGSAGHSGLYGVDVDEGTLDECFGGRRWEVAVTEPDKAREEAKQRKAATREKAKEARETEHRNKLVNALISCKEGETARKLRMIAGMNADTFGTVIRSMLDEGIVVACRVKKGKTEYDAFRLADDQWELE